MKKRFFAALLALCMTLTLLPGTALAAEVVDSGTCGDDLTWTLDDAGTLTISGTGMMENYGDDSGGPWNTYAGAGGSIETVIISPGVTSIGSYAFSGCSSLTSVTIPDGVTTIGILAFYRCSSLTSVTIPDSVTSIGDSAFAECSGLISVTIPDGVTSIGDQVFVGCSSLTSVTIPDGVTSIGYFVFGGCSSLTSVKIPDSVTSIGGSAFVECSSLTSVTIPDGVTSIGDYAFCECSGLTSVTIPDGVTSIGDNAFWGCSSLTSVTIPNSVTSIGDYVFCECSSLTSMTIPGGVTSIGDYAFYGCIGLTSVTIPDSVTSIGDSAFRGCNDLTSVKIPDGVTSIENYVFDGCSGLTSVTIPDSVTSIGDHAFSGCSSLTSVTIPNGVTSIGVGAFYVCSGLTSMRIPDSVTSIGYSVFSGCYSLTSVTIPDGVTSIGDYAFGWCSSLTSVTIPDSVTSIGDYVFYVCSNLTSVKIPDGVTSIGDDAFYKCSSLTSVTIPDSVTSIGDSAFAYCYSLTDVDYSGTIAQWQAIEIGENNDEITTATIHCSDGSLNGDEDEDSEGGAADSFLPAGAVGFLYKAYLNAPENISEPFYTVYSLDSNTPLPDGLTLNEQTGEISGTPRESGIWLCEFSFEAFSLTDDSPLAYGKNGIYYLQIYSAEDLESMGNVRIQAVKGVPFYYEFEWSESCFGVELETPLPDGLNFGYDETRQIFYLSGTPEESGSFLIAAVGLGDRLNNDGDAFAYYYYSLEIADSAAVTLPNGVRYVPYSESIFGEEETEGLSVELSGTLPSGLSLSPSGMITGVPMAAGSWDFEAVIQDQNGGFWIESCTITILNNTDSAVQQQPNDYEIIEPVGDQDPSDPKHYYMTSYRDDIFRIDGPYEEFTRLLIDGRELERDVDYTVEEGSTVITIQAQTFRRVGEGTHTIAAEFRTMDSSGQATGELKQVAQNYTLTIPQTAPSGSSGSGSSTPPQTQAPYEPYEPDEPEEPDEPDELDEPDEPDEPEVQELEFPFTDVSPSDWFYEDLVWAYAEGVMYGISPKQFAPQEQISQATIVIVLARLAQVDLTQFEDEEETDIESGRYFTAAAIWAKRSGLLPEGNTFTGSETTTRSEMAVMLVKYLLSMGKDTTPPEEPIPFADADDMSPEGYDAFQILYRQNIFRGVGGLQMDASGATTRAHFVALIHRIYETAMSND